MGGLSRKDSFDFERKMAGPRSIKSRSAARKKLERLRVAYDQLLRAQAAFIAAVQKDRALPAWCEGEEPCEDSRAAAITIFQSLASQTNGTEVRRQCGVVACSPKTIERAAVFNQAKTAFQTALRGVCPWENRLDIDNDSGQF